MSQRKPLFADDSRHGTENGYGNHGCRCDACREAHRIYQAQKVDRLGTIRPRIGDLRPLLEEAAEYIAAYENGREPPLLSAELAAYVNKVIPEAELRLREG